MTKKMNVWILFFSIGLAVLACRSQEIKLNLTFDNLSGLTKADRIVFEGNEIGAVESVSYNPDGSYTVKIRIDKAFAHAATEYSSFSIIRDTEHPNRKAVKVVLSKTGGTPLESGTTVAGDPDGSDPFVRLQKDLASGFAFFKEQIEKIERDVQQFPESEEYKDLKKSLEGLAAEIEQKEKQAREKVKREWLPRIQKELDELREKLKKNGREEELEPLEKEVDRIRRI